MKDPWADPQIKRWMRHVRENVLPMVERSNVAISLVPPVEKVDIKFAVELGMMIMLDKPIVVVIEPGQQIPMKLAMVADKIVEADITTPRGRMRFMEAMEEFRNT